MHIFTDVFLYKYQRIGGLHRCATERSALRCVCKEFAAIPPAFERPTCYSTYTTASAVQQLREPAFAALNTRRPLWLRAKLWRRHRCDVEVVETSLQTIVVRQPRLVVTPS